MLLVLNPEHIIVRGLNRELPVIKAAANSASAATVSYVLAKHAAWCDDHSPAHEPPITDHIGIQDRDGDVPLHAAATNDSDDAYGIVCAVLKADVTALRHKNIA